MRGFTDHKQVGLNFNRIGRDRGSAAAFRTELIAELVARRSRHHERPLVGEANIIAGANVAAQCAGESQNCSICELLAELRRSNFCRLTMSEITIPNTRLESAITMSISTSVNPPRWE